MTHTYWKASRKTVVPIIAALALTACSGADASSSATETFNVSTMYGPEHYQVRALEAYTDAVTDASDGRLQFEYHYSGSLAAPDAVADGLGSGLVDIAHMVPNYSAEQFPIDNWISSAGAVADAPQPLSALLSATATLDWSLSEPDLLAEYQAAGIQPLLPSFMVLDNYGLLCKEDVTSSADAAGKRVRVGGETWANEAAAVDMVPEQMVPTEVYEAFQRGILDCIMASAPDLANSGYWEIGQEYTDVGFSGFSSYGLFANQARWDSLSEEDRQILWDNLDVFLETLYEDILSEQRRFVEEGEELGVSFNVADESIVTQLSEFQDQKISSLPDNAPASVSDPEASVNNLLAGYEDWEKRLGEVIDVDPNASTWQEWVQSTNEVPDLSEWADLLSDEILEPGRPE